MTTAPLKIAVVGHTNTGKTSLMRTLTRNVSFGEVSDRPATTRHVEGATLTIQGRPVMELYDTPGLEDSIALLEHLDSLRGQERNRRVGLDIVHQFLAGPDSHGRFAQEAKALRQVLASVLVLYVIDARDRVLGKHQDELEILARCAKPVVPVLNFVASPEAQTGIWREHLSQVNMHAVAEFDTVVLDEFSERRLLEKIRTLLDRHHETLDALIQERQRQRQELIRTSSLLVADLLIDAAAYSMTVPTHQTAVSTQQIETLKNRVRAREQQCVDQLLALHQFRSEDYVGLDLPLLNGQWGTDLFSPAALKQFGVHTGSAAAAGAMVGLTLDAMVGGLSLGAGAALGAAIGALAGAGRLHGRRLLDRLRGHGELRCDNATLALLQTRQNALIRVLLQRGHASMTPIELIQHPHAHSTEGSSLRSQLAPLLDAARIRPEWSRLSEPPHHAAVSSDSRLTLQHNIAKVLEQRLPAAHTAG